MMRVYRSSGLRAVLILAVLVVIGLPAQPAWAQAVYGSIAGVVSDPQGGVLPGVSVTITSVERQWSDSVVSNASGFFSKGQLLPGAYEVRAELQGFKVARVSQVSVNIDSATNVDFTLELGTLSEEVVVTATEGQLLKTDRADVAVTFNSKQLTELPVLDRNFTKFILLTPGTQQLQWQHAASENPQASTQTMVNGRHFSGTGYQLDGTANTDPILGIIVINPTLESIGETKITAQNYAAEFGQATAGVVSVQTKSGTNEFHGAVFEFLQRDKFQARNPFSQPDSADPITGRVLPQSEKDQFGAAIGGPLQKNKWFFFADYEAQRNTVGGAQLLSVPTAAARRGDLSAYGVDIFDPLTGLPFPGGVIPGNRLSPQAAAILDLIPLPNASGRDNGTRDNFIAQGTESFDQDAFNVRLDGRLSNSLNVFARYSLASFLLDGPQAFGPGGGAQLVSLGGKSDVKNQSVAAGFDLTVSPTSVLDVRFGFFKYDVGVLPNDFGTAPATAAGIPGLNFDDFSSGLPAGFIRGGGPETVFGSSLDQIGGRCNCPLIQDEKQFQVAVNFTKLLGEHTFKAGVDVRRALNLRVPADRHRSGELTFNHERTASPTAGGGLGLATFLIGDVTNFTRYSGANTNAREQQWRHFYYVQDTWRPTSNLTLDLGLRATIINPQTVNEAGNGGWLDLDTGLINVGGIGDIGLNGDVENTVNWAPRVGITYQLDEKTVVRAGYGRSYDIGVFGSVFGHSVTQNLPVLVIQELNRPGTFDAVFNLEDGPPPAEPVAVGPDGRFALPDGIFQRALPKKMRLPAVDAWNLTVQRQLTDTVSAEVGYVANRSSRTFAEDNPDENINAPTLVGWPDVSQNERKPFFNQFGWTQSIGAYLNPATASYNSVQAKLTRRYSNGWSLLAHYTYQRVRQFGNDYFYIDRDLNYGRPAWDRLNTFTAVLTYELPFARNNTWLGGWQINTNTTISSGLPFDVSYRDSFLDRDTGPGRPNLIGDVNAGQGDGINEPYFNVTPIGSSGSAFGRPDAGTFGDQERNSIDGPGFWQVDASLFKRFRLGGDRSLEFRFEVVNLFNHVNLGNPDSNIGVPGNDNPNAGIISSTAFFGSVPQRNLQFGFRFLF